MNDSIYVKNIDSGVSNDSSSNTTVEIEEILFSCHSNVRESFIPFLNLVMERQKSDCPRRYLSLNAFGRMNNNIVELIKAISISVLLNRTVVLSRKFMETFRAERDSQFDIRDFCIVQEDDPNFVYDINDDPSIISWVWGDGYDTEIFGLPITKEVEMDTALARKNLPYPKISCLAKDMLKYQNQFRLFHIPNIFYTIIDNSIYRYLLSHFSFPDEIVTKGTTFISSVLQNKPFIGVHLRSLEGKCSRDVEVVYKSYDKQAQDEAKMLCNFDRRSLESMLRTRNLNSDDFLYYLASDGQNQYSEQDLLKSKNFYNYKSASSVLDMFILSRSSYFVGLQRSTFAYNVAELRILFGKSPSTNIMPGYNASDNSQQLIFLTPT